MHRNISYLMFLRKKVLYRYHDGLKIAIFSVFLENVLLMRHNQESKNQL